jgi:hypothetical protein
VQTFHEPPSHRPRCSSLSAVGHPRAGTKLHGKGIPRLGKVNREVTQFNRKEFLQGATYAHNSQTLIPHMLVPPQECTPSLSHSPSTATPPFPGLQGQTQGSTLTSAPTSPNYWPFRQHLRSRCSLTRSSNRGLQDTGVYNQRKCKVDPKEQHTEI